MPREQAYLARERPYDAADLFVLGRGLDGTRQGFARPDKKQTMPARLARSSDLAAVIAMDPNAAENVARRRFLESSVARGETWLALTDEEPCGFVVLSYSFYENGFIPLLVVHEAARRRGVGRSLLDHAAGVCKTAKLFTSTNQSNAAMRALLAVACFEPSGIINNLEPNDSELVYVRWCKPL